MADDGLLSPLELLRFTAPSAGRRTEDLQAPFANGSFFGLTLERGLVVEGPDPFWDEFTETNNAGQLGRRWAGMLRAVSGPIAAAAFASRSEAHLLVDELFRRVEGRICSAPRRNQHFIAIAVIRKDH